MKATLTRRGFLKVATLTGTGLAMQIFLPGCTSSTEPAPTATPTRLPPTPTVTPEPTLTPVPEPTLTPTPAATAWTEPDVLVTIGDNGLITVTVPRTEMGQGARTVAAMILAEELGADWSNVRVKQAVADLKYGDQLTGGSLSTGAMFGPMRKAGAVARTILVAAAADLWGVDPTSCFTENGNVIHRDSDRRLPFANLVTKALAMPPVDPAEVTLKALDGKFNLIGTRIGRIDNPEIVTGKAIYGLDVRLPGMLFATVARPPVFGETLDTFDDTAARAISGVRDVVKIGSGVAVVAENTWAAIKGRAALIVNWSAGKYEDLNTVDLGQKLIERATEPLDDPDILEAFYEVPYLAHATMEPMNCVADLQADGCDLWVPTQNPMGAKNRVTQVVTGLPAEAVTVNVTLMGGGFGRRLEGGLNVSPLPVGTDYVMEAVQISRAVGAPVQVVWTRDDDLQHDIYHPMTLKRMRANRNDIKSLVADRYVTSAPIPTGNYRAVENVADAFAHECFVDEFAAATNVDPLDLRRQIVPRAALPVLELAASKGNWGAPLPSGQGRGLAYHASWGLTHVATVAEVEVGSDGQVRVLRVVTAVDCGLAINPDLIEGQIESGIIFGLTTAFKEAIAVERGRVLQTNFHDSPMLRFDEAPKIEVYIVPSDSSVPKGVGEMSNPVVVPAVVNAIYAATGKRLRRLPIKPEDLRA